jgi:predicted Zn-dependent protease
MMIKRAVAAAVLLVTSLLVAAPPPDAFRAGDEAAMVGDWGKAKQAYEAGLAKTPDDPYGLVRLAFVDEQLGKDVDAVKILRGVLARHASDGEAWQLLGLALAKTRAFGEAAEAYEKYLELVPGDAMARLELARAYAANGTAGATKAITQYQRIMKEASDEAVAKLAEEELFGVKYGAAGQQFKDGKSAFVAGDYRGAIGKLEGVVKQYPEIEEAQYLLGMAYVVPEIGRRGEAMRAWSKAPSVKEAQMHLALELHNDGDLKNAETRFRAALKLDGNYQEAWYLLGELYAEKGDQDAARDAWQKALAVDENTPTGRWAQTRLNLDAGNVEEPFEEGEVVDPATEILLGRKLTDSILKEYPPVVDEKTTARLEAIWDRLVAVADRGDLRYKLVVFKYDVPNGYTLPGGNVLIPSAMVDTIRLRLGDKDEFYAALFSHELAHATLRHNTETVRFQQAKLRDENAEQMMADLRVRASRQQEYEADKYGALYMYRAGYNPKFMLDFWKLAPSIFGESEKGDHGTHEERAAVMRMDLIELRGRALEFERGNEALKNGDYAAAQDHYEVFLALLPGSAPGRLNYAVALHRDALKRIGADQKYKRTTDIDPDAKLMKIEVNSTEKHVEVDPRVNQRLLREAGKAYQAALKIDPSYAMARAGYGALLMDLGQTKEAIKVLEKATRIAPGYASAWNNLGVAYAMAGDAKKAQSTLDQATKLDAKLADPWFNLGVVLADGGKSKEAAGAYDEYAKRDPEGGWSKAARARRAELTKKPK